MSDRLSRRTKLLYGVGDTGFSLTTTIIGAYFLIFLVDVVGIAPGIVAIAFFVVRSWDWINDPLFGHLSDRTRTRWGRRRPFLLFGAVPFALSFAMLWWRPPWDSQVILALYFGAAYFLFEAAATFIYMPYFALTPELTPDYDERTALTTYRMFFSILGSLVAFTIPLLIVGTFSPENAPKVLIMGMVFAVLSALPLFLTFAGTRERQEFMEQKRPSLFKSLRSALGNPPFLFGLVIFLVTWVAVEILQGTLLFFVKYVVQRDAQNDLIMASIFVTALLALPLWEWISRRWSKRWAYAGGIAFWAAVQIAMITLSPATGLGLILTLCILAGIGVSAAHVLTWAIIPDAIEWSELQTGQRTEGMFYSLVTLIRKIVTSLAVPAVGLVLQFSGYVPNAAQQPTSALTGIRILIGPVPAVLLCIGILFAILYPLSREDHTRLVRELADRRGTSREEAG
jgi:GPH family glycoside/pentoside/hexuronide:cation symporter